jgi:hypothetical protein
MVAEYIFDTSLSDVEIVIAAYSATDLIGVGPAHDTTARQHAIKIDWISRPLIILFLIKILADKSIAIYLLISYSNKNIIGVLGNNCVAFLLNWALFLQEDGRR